jgi:MFS family permease
LAALILVPNTITTFAISPLSGTLVGKFGTRLPAMLAASLLCLALVELAFSTGPHTPLWQLWIGYLLFGMALGFANAPATNGAVSALPKDQAGVASAITSTSRQIGNGLGVAIFGTIVFSAAVTANAAHAIEFGAGLRNAYLITAVLIGVFGISAMWLFKPRGILET